MQAALKRQPTDRPPYAFWRHFPDVDRNAAALAQSTLRFHERYQCDFLKVTPAGGMSTNERRLIAIPRPPPPPAATAGRS